MGVFQVGGNGAQAAGSRLINAVSGSTTGGTLSLGQTAYAGSTTNYGYHGLGPAAIAAGAAYSSLTFNDVTANPTQASTFKGDSRAYGGSGGYSEPNSAPGGAAFAAANLAGAHYVSAYAKARGGYGGKSYLGSPAAAGTATAVSTATSTTTGSDGVKARAMAHGGYGASDFSGLGAGAEGVGGAATANATATENSATGGVAYAAASAFGAQGGSAGGSRRVGGTGGIASGTTASATGSSVNVSAVQTSGGGGRGQFGGSDSVADGGAGADSTLTNAVSGTSNGGYIKLYQHATGGIGGPSVGAWPARDGFSLFGGTGGAGGAATSDLTLSDNGTIKASSLTGQARADGGAGGYTVFGSDGGAAGGAEASIYLAGANAVTATARAFGGGGGPVLAASGYAGTQGTGNAGTAGAATASSVAKSSSASQAVKSYSRAYGGAGGYGFGAGKSASAGGRAQSEADSYSAAGIGTSALSNAYAKGGYGRSGGGGATSSAGGSAFAFAHTRAINSGPSATPTATAKAVGGAGPTQGDGTASASAVSTNGTRATAIATATGSISTANSAAATYSSGIVTKVAAGTVGTGGGTIVANSAAQLGGFSGLGGVGNYAGIVGLPDASTVGTVLASNPNLQAAFGGPSALVLGEGSEGSFAASTTTGLQVYFSSITWTLDTTTLTGDVIAGLVSSQAFGAGFSSLVFDAYVGSYAALHQTFTTVASAQSFFTDNAIDLGALPPVEYPFVEFQFTLYTSTTGQGFGEEFLLGTAACFCPGTLIRTTAGEVAIEHLAPGDLVQTADGATRPIRWIGRRRLDLRRHPEPDQAQPIRIRADAFADGVPRRDLLLSPDHAVLWRDALVPVRLLVNGASIIREDSCHRVTYYHLELDTHDILLAENLPAESYLDTGNRGLFENADAPLILHPDFESGQERRVAESCRPFADTPTLVEPIWRRLAARAVALGFALPPDAPTTRDPNLCVIIDSRVFKPVAIEGATLIFVLPRSDRTLRLVSRSARPCDTCPRVEDRRRLGVMLSRLTVSRDGSAEPIPLDHPDLAEGWWAVERDGTSMWRWTNGDATLIVPGADRRPVVLTATVSGTVDYPLSNTPAPAVEHSNTAPRSARVASPHRMIVAL